MVDLWNTYFTGEAVAGLAGRQQLDGCLPMPPHSFLHQGYKVLETDLSGPLELKDMMVKSITASIRR